MYMTLMLDGVLYESAKTDGMTVKEAEETFYKVLEEMKKFQMNLKDGSILILNRAGLDRAHMVFHP